MQGVVQPVILMGVKLVNMRILTCCLGLLVPAASEAAIVTFNVAGEITDVQDPNGYISSTGIAAGTLFSGFFSYDSDTAGLYSPNAWYTSYGSLAPSQYTIDSQYGITSIATFVTVKNDAPDDPFPDELVSYIFGVSFGFPTNLGSNLAYVSFSDQDGTALSSTAVPTSLLLSEFETATFTFQLAVPGADSVTILGQVTALTVTTERIPEPATLALFGLGLAGFGAMRRKKLVA